MREPAGKEAGRTSQSCSVGVLQPGYLPWLGYFDLVALSDVFIVYDDVQFDRGGWRNRNRLLAKGEPEWITVPVKKRGHAFIKISDVEIIDNNWQKKHLKKIAFLYGKAPFFDWCYPVLEKYLTKKKYNRLLDLCLEGHDHLVSLIGIESKVKLSSEIGYEGVGRTERLRRMCEAMNATTYIATDASKTYMEEQMWKEAGIELKYQHYPHPEYKQSGDGFVSHLSVVDALMFVGPEVASFLAVPR